MGGVLNGIAQCESWILGSRIAASVASTNYARDSKASGPTMRTIRSWIFLIVMQMQVLSKLFANGSTSYETTPETLAIVTVVSRIETTTRHPPCHASARVHNPKNFFSIKCSKSNCQKYPSGIDFKSHITFFQVFFTSQ